MPHTKLIYSGVNTVLWISSLKEEEIGLSNRILEDLASLLDASGVSLKCFEVNSIQEMKWLTTDLSFRILQGMRPIIHLDMHGCETGLQIVKSGEIYPWSYFCNAFSIINRLSKNELMIFSTACFGLKMIEGIDPVARSPFSCLIAPQSEIKAGYLADNVLSFYKSLFETQSIDEAFKKTLGQPFKIFSSHDVFLVLMSAYYEDHCSGMRKITRREQLLSKVVDAGRARNSQEIKFARSYLKSALQFDEALVKKYSNYFLGPEDKFEPSLDLIKQLAQLRRQKKLSAPKKHREKGGL